jgi:hypothetical protein
MNKKRLRKNGNRERRSLAIEWKQESKTTQGKCRRLRSFAIPPFHHSRKPEDKEDSSQSA